MTSKDKNREEYTSQELEQLLSAMKGMQVPPSSRTKEDAWGMLMQSVTEEKGLASVVSINKTRVWFAAAASVIVLLVAGWSFIWFASVDSYCFEGNMATISMPDGSQVILNADTRIEYPKYLFAQRRNVNINGEAYFKVVPGSKFSVTDSLNRCVEVVGTEFNVNSRGKTYSVVCYQGKVNVSIPEGKPVALLKGQKVEEIDKKLSLNTVADSSTVPLWTKGEFYFSGAPLSDVIAELERQFNITVQVSGLDPTQHLYTGFFRKNNLKEALDLVTLPMGLSYEITDSHTVIIKILR